MKDKTSRISASMMCANPFFLQKIFSELEKEKIDYLHIDIMDGIFVPNLGIGLDQIRFMRESTSIPFDFHLMGHEPERILQLLELQKQDIVSIHYESTFQVQRTLEKAKNYGCKCFLAVNPATALSSIEEVLHYIDGINLLMVNPGFSGQKMVPSCFQKAKKLSYFLAENDCSHLDVEVDGNITFENAHNLCQTVANIFVAGTSSIFDREGIIKNSIEKLRRNISDHIF